MAEKRARMTPDMPDGSGWALGAVILATTINLVSGLLR
jgi:hypothetical protein